MSGKMPLLQSTRRASKHSIFGISAVFQPPPGTAAVDGGRRAVAAARPRLHLRLPLEPAAGHNLATYRETSARQTSKRVGQAKGLCFLEHRTLRTDCIAKKHHGIRVPPGWKHIVQTAKRVGAQKGQTEAPLSKGTKNYESARANSNAANRSPSLSKHNLLGGSAGLRAPRTQ